MPAVRILIDPQRWYTVPEVAAFLGMKEHEVCADCRARRMAGAMFPRGRGAGEWWVTGAELLRLRPDLPHIKSKEASLPGPYTDPSACEVDFRAAVLDRLDRIEGAMVRLSEVLGARPPCGRAGRVGDHDPRRGE